MIQHCDRRYLFCPLRITVCPVAISHSSSIVMIHYQAICPDYLAALSRFGEGEIEGLAHYCSYEVHGIVMFDTSL
jgi:hypothetical protein